MPSNVSVPIVIVDRNGDLRESRMSSYTPYVLRKKCNCKPSSKFELHAEWAYSECDAGQENKYEFPPPVDTLLFFGACALVAKDMTHQVIPLTVDKWDKMYNFLFGGFDTLANYEDDENEEDELDSIPAIRKTKDGYLKDGFVVDTSSCDNDDEDEEEEEDEDEEDDEEDDEEEEEEDDDNVCSKQIMHPTKIKLPVKHKRRDKKQPKEEPFTETLSELTEEAYEYSDD